MEVVDINRPDKVKDPDNSELIAERNESGAELEQPLIKIRPSKGWVALNLRDLWVYRELLYFLWRDIKVRYKQTLLGASWAIIQPLFTMLLFTLFFGKLAKLPFDGIPKATYHRNQN